MRIVDLNYTPNQAVRKDSICHQYEFRIYGQKCNLIQEVIMFDKEQIKAVIPHRDPFLFIDEITMNI